MIRDGLVICLVGLFVVAASCLVWGAPGGVSATGDAVFDPVAPPGGATASQASLTGGGASGTATPAALEPVPPPPAAGDPADVIPRSWLQKRTTVEEAEKQNLVTNERLGSAPVPFGFINARWVEFKGRMQAGDELWEFSSSSASWEHLAGRGGLCIVRQGRIVDCFVTIMN